MNLTYRLRSYIYYYFRCFKCYKTNRDPDLSDCKEDYTEDETVWLNMFE